MKFLVEWHQNRGMFIGGMFRSAHVCEVQCNYLVWGKQRGASSASNGGLCFISLLYSGLDMVIRFAVEVSSGRHWPWHRQWAPNRFCITGIWRQWQTSEPWYPGKINPSYPRFQHWEQQRTWHHMAKKRICDMTWAPSSTMYVIVFSLSKKHARTHCVYTIFIDQFIYIYISIFISIYLKDIISICSHILYIYIYIYVYAAALEGALPLLPSALGGGPLYLLVSEWRNAHDLALHALYA